MHKDARLEYKLWGMLVFCDSNGQCDTSPGYSNNSKTSKAKVNEYGASAPSVSAWRKSLRSWE